MKSKESSDLRISGSQKCDCRKAQKGTENFGCVENPSEHNGHHHFVSGRSSEPPELPGAGQPSKP